MSAVDYPHILPQDLAAWRAWLTDHHRTQPGVWVQFAKKGSGLASVSVDDAIDEALCFGWIDSVPKKVDAQRFRLLFSPRNPNSNWSRVNKVRVARLQAQGRLQPAGEEMIALAKATGTWTALDAVEALIVPPDLQAAFAQYPPSADNWEAFPRSARRGILEWIFNAKRPETRARRILETATLAARNERANQFRR